MEGFNRRGAGPISNFHYIFHWWLHGAEDSSCHNHKKQVDNFFFKKKAKITVNKKEKE